MFTNNQSLTDKSLMSNIIFKGRPYPMDTKKRVTNHAHESNVHVAAKPARVLPARPMRGFNRLAETTRNVGRVPIKAQRTAPIELRFRASKAHRENPARTKTPDAIPHARLEHGRIETNRRREAIAPRIEREPQTEYAKERAVPT